MKKFYQATTFKPASWAIVALALMIGCTPQSSSSDVSSSSTPTTTANQSSESQAKRTTFIMVDRYKLEVEIADRNKTRMKGLMHRTNLGPYQGMLFLYPTPRVMAMWMKNTVLPLDVAFINEQGVILNIATMEPLSLTNHNSYGLAVYALETNAGWFKQHGIEPGTQLKGLPDYRQAEF